MTAPSTIALAVAIMAPGAPAQPQPPSDEQLVENVYRLTDCLVRRGDRNLERVLATVPGARDSNVPWLLAAIGPCLAGRRPLPSGSFYPRGAVAERFLYRDFAEVGLAKPRRTAVPVFPPVGRAYLASADEYSRTYLFLLDMASCVVRAEPQRVFALFRTGTGSAAERSALSELVPAISACTFQGQTFDMAPSVFRSVLAEAAYRVSAGQANVFEVAQ
jgi:hypothetical protein